jgi:hypothetical protein
MLLKIQFVIENILLPLQISTGYIGFQVLTTVVMKSTIIWDITPYIPLKSTVSEKHVASIFRVEEQPKQEPSVKQVASTTKALHLGRQNSL